MNVSEELIREVVKRVLAESAKERCGDPGRSTQNGMRHYGTGPHQL